MILVDKDIKARASEIFEKGYDENNVKPVSLKESLRMMELWNHIVCVRTKLFS